MSNEKVKPAEVVLGLERKEATASGAFLDSLLSLAADDPKLAEALPFLEATRDKLRAALDSLPVEEREYQVVAIDDGVLVPAGRLGGLEENARAMHARPSFGYYGVRIQSRTVTTFSDGSSLTSPWTDLPSEEGQGA